jgi:adenylate cyclase
MAGRRAAEWTRVRIDFTEIDRPSGTISRTSAWVPAITVWQAAHSPQPCRGHCSAAANARAATERPEPGGPVKSQAWVMAAGSSAAWRSSATAAGWPTTSSQTLTGPPVRSSAVARIRLACRTLPVAGGRC